MAVSGGYPGSYAKGKLIEGLDTVDGIVFHAGTACDAEGRVVTAGGRVLATVAFGEDIPSRIIIICNARQDQLRGQIQPPRHRQGPRVRAITAKYSDCNEQFDNHPYMPFTWLWPCSSLPGRYNGRSIL